MPDQPAILIVDDEPGVCWAMSELARSMGYAAKTAGDAAAALAALREGRFDAVVLDIQLPGLSGLEALPRLKAVGGDLPVIVITAYGTMETAVAAVQRGAFEYLIKPVDMETLKTALAAAVARRQSPPLPPAPAVADAALVGRCPAMQEVFKQIALAAPTEMAVLVQGQTGTGKELVSRAIHRYSNRAGGPFVAVNCSLLSGELMASELFGHEKGAFTGADRANPGKVEVAEGGTLLLDEIGDLAQEAQARLLRFLDNGEFYRVGSAQPRKANVRIIAASNRPLRPAALAGQFRRDLFFRVSGITIDLPPLCQRAGDLGLLIDHFLGRCAPGGIDPAARTLLEAYIFPGNVRELKNIIEHAAAMAAGKTISAEHLSDAVRLPAATGQCDGLDHQARSVLEEIIAAGGPQGYEQAMNRWEKPLLEAGLKKFQGNQARLAGALGMHRATLRKKLRAHGLLGGPQEPEQ